jgi:hypothetical protein
MRFLTCKDCGWYFDPKTTLDTSLEGHSHLVPRLVCLVHQSYWLATDVGICYNYSSRVQQLCMK